ncbi:MAG: hypothetical protein Q7U97_10635 [Rhodocyclaceae bacterium]|nr:hypothetical protein [Rhodocyclaceae bacterium]
MLCLRFLIRYLLAFSSAYYLGNTALAADDQINQKLIDARTELQKILDDPKNPKSPANAKSREQAILIGRVDSLLDQASSTIQKLKSEQDQAKKQQADLESKISAAAIEREELKKQHDELKQIQSQLASGLVGAIVTAIVAIAGAFLTALNSKPERDLKRLTVIEKANELKKSGVAVPEDIVSQYAISQTSA